MPQNTQLRRARRAVAGPALALVMALSLAVAVAPAPSAQAAPAAAPATSMFVATAGVSRRQWRSFRSRILRIARSKRGAPYRYGASGPYRFDCSGYTSFVYRKAGRRIPRTSRQQAGASRRVRFRQRRRGDLVFFHNRGRVYHVGIYAGKGHIWHSPSTGKRVSRQRIWTRSHFYGRFRPR